MIDIDTLVGRLMELETKFYDLQERYHHLINEYESLRDSNEKLKAEHESSTGHRNKPCTRCDSCVCDKGC